MAQGAVAAEYAVLRQAERACRQRRAHRRAARRIYSCRACGNELFRSETKFESHCGWPSFYESLAGDTVERIEDHSHGMVRTEVRCKKCGSHLGHVFDDAPQTPTGERYCMNSVALKFAPR